MLSTYKCDEAKRKANELDVDKRDPDGEEQAAIGKPAATAKAKVAEAEREATQQAYTVIPFGNTPRPPRANANCTPILDRRHAYTPQQQ